MSWFPAPKPPPYDPYAWRARPWAERLRMACQAWALDGYGAPLAIYLLYVGKVVAYVAAWAFFCGFNEDADLAQGQWAHWFTADAFKKAVLWSMAFEGLGMGCASGPLTGRYLPPVAAPFHFLRPGTIKLPPLLGKPWAAGLPLIGSDRRGWPEVALYAAHLAFLARALVAPTVTPALVLPCVVVVALLGMADKTIFLACRAEHYWAMLVCFLFPDWLAGAMVIQLALWFWAAAAKLNGHFPSVIAVMTSNSPLVRSRWIRRQMYRSYPDDLRPSGLANGLAHAGTVLEFAIPALIVAGLVGGNSDLVFAGVALMLAFHIYITSNFPMAVPIEWNVMMVYGGLFLFGTEPQVSPADLQSTGLLLFLGVSVGVVPLVGAVRPSVVSFLMAMRYYTGNWGYSVWLFRGDSASKLDQGLTKISGLAEDQLAHFYDEGTIIALMGKVPAFRAMHLHGRALQTLLPQAVDDIEAYTYADGEVIAGLALGYNFGDGHLHDHRLLAAIQARCGFEPGELRHIFVESQPLFGGALSWQIRDAAEGRIASGEIAVADLHELLPWPAVDSDAITGS